MNLTMREWQQAAMAAWEHAGRRGYVEVATGGGKTLFALAAASSWLAATGPRRVVVLVPTLPLQDQWVVEIERFFGLQDDAVATAADALSLPQGSQHVVLVVNSARGLADSSAIDFSTVMLIADECHRYATPSNATALFHAGATLGLTATAAREWDDGVSEVLEPRLGAHLYSYSLAEAIRDGVVEAFRSRNVEISLLEHEEQDYRQLSSAIGRAQAQGDEDLLKRLAIKRSGVVKNAEMRVPVARLLMRDLLGRRTLIFCEYIDQAQRLHGVLIADGHLAAEYHTGLDPAIRRDNLRQFRQGAIHVLVTCKALDEGIDVPEAEQALVVSASRSSRQRVQRIGRVLRRGESKQASVATIYATAGEREALLREQLSLGSLTSVSWQRVVVSRRARS